MKRTNEKGDVRARVAATGERVTEARVRVLACLSEAKRALSHHDLETALPPRSIDRVTLYRVLDWLVEKSLAYRLAGTGRVSRYMASDREHGTHAHFQCRECGKTICLEGVSTQGLALTVPRGYRPEASELTVRGACAECD
jgi:Fur family ferric uptake transcriptional regulator